MNCHSQYWIDFLSKTSSELCGLLYFVVAIIFAEFQLYWYGIILPISSCANLTVFERRTLVQPFDSACFVKKLFQAFLIFKSFFTGRFCVILTGDKFSTIFCLSFDFEQLQRFLLKLTNENSLFQRLNFVVNNFVLAMECEPSFREVILLYLEVVIILDCI